MPSSVAVSFESSDSTNEYHSSLWGQARPPQLIAENCRIEVFLGVTLIASSASVIRVVGGPGCPTTFYIPREDVRTAYMKTQGPGRECQWRGQAEYFTIDTGAKKAPQAACYYANPTDTCKALADHICFHPARVNCYIDGERVWSENSDTQGAWITSKTI